MQNRITTKFVHTSCCLLLFCLLWPNAAIQAQTPLLDTVIVAVAPNSPPFIDEANAGNFVGFDIDILKNLVRLSGLQIRYEKTNFSYVIPGVASQLYDTALGCLFVNDARRKMVNFTNPYFTTGLVLVVQISNDTIHSLKDLTPTMRVSLEQATAAEDYARQQVHAHIQSVRSSTLALQQVVERAADAVIIDEMTAKAYMKTRVDVPLRIVGFLTHEQCAFPVNKNDSALLAALNQALGRLKNSRQYDSIYRKWFGDRQTTLDLLTPVTPTVPLTTSVLTPQAITSSIQIASPITVTPQSGLIQQWAGVYYLMTKADAPDAPTAYQLVTLTSDGIWAGAEMHQSSAPITFSQRLSDTNGIVNQQGAWQADATGNITATVLSLQTALIDPPLGELQRWQYRLTIAADGSVTGQSTRTPYRLGANPFATSSPLTQTETSSVTGQKVKP